MRYAYLLLLAGLSFQPQSQAQTVNRQAKLTWEAPTACEGGAAIADCPVTGYRVEKQLNGTWTQIATTAPNVLTYTESNLGLGSHTYRVIAVAAGGVSPPSNTGSKTFAVPGAPGNLIITITVAIAP